MPRILGLIVTLNVIVAQPMLVPSQPIFDEQFHVCDVTTSCEMVSYKVQSKDIFRIQFSGVEIVEVIVRRDDGASYSIVGNWSESAFKPRDLRGRTFIDLNMANFQCRGLWDGSEMETVFNQMGAFEFFVKFRDGKQTRTTKFRIIQTFFRIPGE